MDRGVTLVLVLVLAVTAIRARALLRPALPLDSHGEASFPWAYRNAAAIRLLRDSEPSLRYGELLWVTVPASDPRYDAGWVKVMANYWWPDQKVLGVAARTPRRGRGVAVVEVNDRGVTVARNGPRAGNASP